MKKTVSILMLLVSTSIFAQETLNVMFYNLLEFPSASPSNRPIILQNILSLYEPDVFMVCELENQQGSDAILDVSLNGEQVRYVGAQFATNQSDPDDELQQMLYYRLDKFTLESQNIFVTGIRDINKYVLQLNTVDGDTNPLLLNFYVTHLKSSEGSANEQLRLDSVIEFTNDLDNLDPDSYVFFAGDLNLYDDQEPALIELLDPSNAIVMEDPINVLGDWHNNETFAPVHTQSTRVSSAGFGAGAGGGMDDRFDFILMSQNLNGNPFLEYVPNSYSAYGNNGNCYNLSVNDTACAGEFSQSLRSNLYSMSDHLPVVMQLQTNQEIVLNVPASEILNNQLSLESTLIDTHISLSMAQFTGDVPFEIYSVIGQKVYEDQLENKNQMFDVNTLSSGLYYLVTPSNTNQEPLKFVKQ